jgi:hypothetical protein
MTMIMQGTTPRALTWKGLLAVLGLSALLLPLAPTWAQQKPTLTLEEEFWSALTQNHELNDLRFPFLIKAREVDGHTLIDATFQHRAGGGDPDQQDPSRPDMTVQARKADVQFYPDRAVARAMLDAVELTNPRDDVPLLIKDQLLEIPIFTRPVAAVAVAVAGADDDDDEDEEASSPAAKDPARREKSDGDKPGATPKRKDVRVYRLDGEGGEQSIQALEKMLAELKELAARKPGGPLDERAREQVERAIDRLKSLLEKRRAEPAPAKARKPETGPRAKSEVAKESAEAAEQRAEIARLKAEVAERHKAWMEAQRRLTEAIRRQASAGAGSGPMARAEQRFEFRFGGPGAGPREQAQEKSIRIVPRADQDKRIAELEERLEKLQNEVKSLRKDAPAEK